MPNRIAILLVSLIVVLVGTPATAQADGTTQLPFAGNGQVWLAVDPSGGHVFVSGGAGASSIVVLNYSGQIVKTITGEAGASQMALDSSTHTLYVALHDATAISEIDTQTLTETKRFSTAPYPNPTSLVIAAGKLWFSCANGNSGCLVSANLDGTGMATPISGGNFPLFLAAGGTDNHLLAFGYSEDSPPNLYVYDVSSDTPTQVGNVTAPSSSEVADMAFDPSGNNLLLATGAPYFIQALGLPSLTQSGAYPTGPYPAALAVTADGKFVAGGVDSGTGENDVLVYPAGSTKPVRTWAVGSGIPRVPAHSLAFAPDASRLFAVTNGPGGHLEFSVLLKPTVRPRATRTSLTRSAKLVQYGHTTTLTAHVKGTSGGRVDLYATTGSNVETLVADRTVKKDVATFRVKPSQNTVYSAELEQGPTYASSTSRRVRISVRPAVAISVHQIPKVVIKSGRRGIRTNFLGTTRPLRPSVVCSCGTQQIEKMEFVIQSRGGASWHTVLTVTATIGGNGIAGAWLVSGIPGLYRVEAVYKGDTAFIRSASAWKQFEVRRLPGSAG